MHPRRFVSIPGYVVAFLLLVIGAPIWLPLCAIVDLVRRRSVALRCAAFLIVFFSSELAGLAVCAALSIWKPFASPGVDRWRTLHYRLQTWWGSTIFRAIVHLFSLRVEVEDIADLGRGPYLLLVRHVSSADTLLASAFVTGPHGIRLRYVLKRELLWDPCIDVVGNRLSHVFIDRHSADSGREIELVESTTRDLGLRDGVLIYPEGTRFTTEKRERILRRLDESGDAEALASAKMLHRVLPPRPGGVLALLRTAPAADVVVCSHTGFEGTTTIGQIWRGALVSRTVRVQFRRVSRNAIPDSDSEALTWLRSEWRRMDGWVSSHSSDGNRE
jgi:1-acyl-sn-glycerol-3-phosphate acyltransferase